MALIGYEWLIVVAIVLILFLWGPKKLPELARSLGLAKKEFQEGVKSSPPSKEDKDESAPEREEESS